MILGRSRLLEADRYHDTDGNPYFFHDWQQAQLLYSDGSLVRAGAVNYNGFSHELEIRVGEQTYALDKRWFLRALFISQGSPDADTVIFQYAVHRDLSDQYAVLAYQGKSYELIRQFRVVKVKKEFHELGAAGVLLEFKPESIYFLRKQNVLILLKLQKKKLAEAFGYDSRITDFMESNKLNLSQEKDLVRLVQYADSLY